MDTPSLCRCCLAQECHKDLSTEYIFEGETEVYSEMLTNTFNISLNHTRNAKELICDECIISLRQAAKFKKRVKASEKTFMKMLAPEEASVTLKVESIDYDDGFDFDDRVDDNIEWDDGDTELKEDKGTIKISTSNSEEDCDTFTQPKEAQKENENLLPPKSKKIYLTTYDLFLNWKKVNKANSFSEKVFLTYFKELANKYKPSSLWCVYSMLRTTVKTNNKIDIKEYLNLTSFLKRKSDGFTGRKCKVLSPTSVEKFLKEAPDFNYLATKVAIIFIITGACKPRDLTDIKTNDVETHGDLILVKIKNTKNKIPRSFTIHGPFFQTVKKYEALRSKNAKNDRFFLNYQKGKCTSQPIGINKFGAMSREIAKFLDLPEAGSYTGHSLRRASATLPTGSGADATLKQHGGARSDAVAESCDEDPTRNKSSINEITSEIKIEPLQEDICIEPKPSTSRDTSYYDLLSNNNGGKTPKIEFDFVLGL